jgi:hypothetical protein
MLISLWRLGWRAFTLFARVCKLWHIEVAVETQRDLIFLFVEKQNAT